MPVINATRLNARRPSPPLLRWRAGLSISLIVGALTIQHAVAHDRPQPVPTFEPIEALVVEGFTQDIPGTTVSIDMVSIPAGTLTRPDPADPTQTLTIDIPAFSMSSTEILWDAYDIFVFSLDQPDPSRPTDADVVARPSKPYLPPDRGFGHAGYPALSMTHHAAEQFCVWLSAKTGLTYRLATEDEWEYACRAGSDAAYCFGDDEQALDQVAWFVGSANWTTHPAASLAPNTFGLYDMHGNAAEWTIGHDGKPIVCGGSYLSEAADVAATSRLRQTRDWQASDPQIPRSKWWLADAPHVGFRIVCETPAP